MRASLVVASILAVGGVAHADQAYDGPRLAFPVPDGAKVSEVSDAPSAYALQLALPARSKLAQLTLRMLLSNDKIADAEVESTAAGWRQARLRNRASWGVHGRGASQAEVTHVGGRRVVRYADQLGSVLGATGQLMLCTSVSARMICATASGPTATAHEVEAVLDRMLDGATIKKTK